MQLTVGLILERTNVIPHETEVPLNGIKNNKKNIKKKKGWVGGGAFTIMTNYIKTMRIKIVTTDLKHTVTERAY